MDQTKICNICGETKSHSEFFEKFRYCKTCHNAKRRKKYKIAKQNQVVVESNQPIESVTVVLKPREPYVPEYVYILTDPERTIDQFKIGKHRGLVSNLSKRYHTAIPNHIIVRMYETGNARKHESNIHELLKVYRIPNSEWFKLEKKLVCKLVDTYFLRNFQDSQESQVSQLPQEPREAVLSQEHQMIQSNEVFQADQSELTTSDAESS